MRSVKFKSPYANVAQWEWQRAGESLWEQMESGIPTDTDIEFELERLREQDQEDRELERTFQEAV